MHIHPAHVHVQDMHVTCRARKTVPRRALRKLGTEEKRRTGIYTVISMDNMTEEMKEIE